MSKLKINQRVEILNHDFLSDGYILQVIKNFGVTFYVIKLDEKAPNTYAWETDEILMFAENLKVIN
jgi:hypothetical protein